MYLHSLDHSHLRLAVSGPAKHSADRMRDAMNKRQDGSYAEKDDRFQENLQREKRATAIATSVNLREGPLVPFLFLFNDDPMLHNRCELAY